VFEAGTARINVRYVPHGAFTVTGDKTLKLLTVHIVDKGKPLYIPAKPWRPENRRDNRPQQGRSPGPVERQGCQNVRRLITTARRKLHQMPV
jgi:hypothetical protein